MALEAWSHEVVFVAPGDAPALLPRRVDAGKTRVVIDEVGELHPAIAFLRGPLARRYSAEWAHGRLSGTAQIDLAPAASYATELSIGLRRPGGPLGRVLVPGGWLNRWARALATELRQEMEAWVTRSRTQQRADRLRAEAASSSALGEDGRAEEFKPRFDPPTPGGGDRLVKDLPSHTVRLPRTRTAWINVLRRAGSRRRKEAQ